MGYLSNRSASLLSLKQYSAASVDARRAITLAPYSGKAHARLGQALYFLKDYNKAEKAYELAVRYEPENHVTWTYLDKSRKKIAKMVRRKQRLAQEEALTEKEVTSCITDNEKQDDHLVFHCL